MKKSILYSMSKRKFALLLVITAIAASLTCYVMKQYSNGDYFMGIAVGILWVEDGLSNTEE